MSLHEGERALAQSGWWRPIRLRFRRSIPISDEAYVSAGVRLDRQSPCCTIRCCAPSGRRQVRLEQDRSLNSQRHEFLCPLALHVTEINRAIRSHGHAVNPIQVTRLFLAVFAFRKNSQELDVSLGIELQEYLIFGWCREHYLRRRNIGPSRRRTSANVDLVILRDHEVPGRDDVLPFRKKLSG